MSAKGDFHSWFGLNVLGDWPTRSCMSTFSTNPRKSKLHSTQMLLYLALNLKHVFFSKASPLEDMKTNYLCKRGNIFLQELQGLCIFCWCNRELGSWAANKWIFLSTQQEISKSQTKGKKNKVNFAHECG